MQKQFLELKRQLAELSETINKFESEAVQLRIVELLFDQSRGGSQFAEPEAEAYDPGPSRGRRRAAPAGRSQKAARPGKAQAASAETPTASGAVAALAMLIDSDFFREKRTIGEIVKKCEDEYKVRYKSNAFSGPLSRYAKKGALKREKNADGNYVYFK